MNSNPNAQAPTNPQAEQQQPRVPDIPGPLYGALQKLSGFLGQARLTQSEHAEAQQLFNGVLLLAEEHTRLTRQFTIDTDAHKESTRKLTARIAILEEQLRVAGHPVEAALDKS